MDFFVEGKEVLFGLIASGLLLLIVEMVIPGFGIFGLLGLGAFGFGEYVLATQGSWAIFGSFLLCLAFILLCQVWDLYFCISASVIFFLSGFILLLVDGMDIYVLYIVLALVCVAILAFVAISRSTTWKSDPEGKSDKTLIGSKGTALSDLNPDGLVRLTHGRIRKSHEDWTAVGQSPIKEGDSIVVTDVCGNVLRVKKD